MFVTGSNSKLLHGKLQDKLTGRAKEFELYPFTYLETIEYKKANGIEVNENSFDDYLQFGGLPQRFEEVDDSEIRQYLIDLFKSIVEKDVFGNHKKINKIMFEQIGKYIISTTGRAFSALSISKYIKSGLTNDEYKSISKTISSYAKYLEECYFMTECLPYYLKGKERLQGVKKYYAIDVGLRNALGNAVDFDDTFALEGVIYNELKVRGYEVKYGKMRNGEIDFVAFKDKKKCLIQVAYLIKDQATYEREYGVFEKITDASPRYVISLDKKDTSHNGITHLNIIDFLLGKVDLSLS